MHGISAQPHQPYNSGTNYNHSPEATPIKETFENFEKLVEEVKIHLQTDSKKQAYDCLRKILPEDVLHQSNLCGSHEPDYMQSSLKQELEKADIPEDCHSLVAEAAYAAGKDHVEYAATSPNAMVQHMAIAYMTASALLGNNDAQIWMSNYHAKGGDSKLATYYAEAAEPEIASYKMGESYAAIGDDKSAFASFQLAADKGHSAACYEVSKYYAEGRGVGKDEKMASHYLQEAVKDASCPAAALCDYGKMLGSYDRPKAMYHFDLAIAAKYTHAYYERAVLSSSMSGSSVCNDLKAATERRHPEASFEYGIAHLFKGAPESLTNIKKSHLAITASQEMTGSGRQSNLGSEHYTKQGILCLQTASRAGHPEASYVLGVLHSEGKIAEKSEQKALDYLKTAYKQATTGPQKSTAFALTVAQEIVNVLGVRSSLSATGLFRGLRAAVKSDTPPEDTLAYWQGEVDKLTAQPTAKVTTTTTSIPRTSAHEESKTDFWGKLGSDLSGILEETFLTSTTSTTPEVKKNPAQEAQAAYASDQYKIL